MRPQIFLPILMLLLLPTIVSAQGDETRETHRSEKSDRGAFGG